MNTNRAPKDAAKTLYGPTVQYPDGKLIPGGQLDVEHALMQFEHLDADARSAFLCVIAHDLTVAIRSIVFEPNITEADIERIKSINELLHQLTSCVNPHKRWSAHDEAMLIRAIIESSFDHGFDWCVGRAIAAAAPGTIERSVTAE